MRACVPNEVLAVTAEHGLFEEALDESVIVHPPNGPAPARASMLDSSSRRGGLFNGQSYSTAQRSPLTSSTDL